MIAIEKGYESPRAKLDNIVDWIEKNFAHIPPNQYRVLIDFVNAVYNFEFAKKGLEEKPGDPTLTANQTSSETTINSVEKELLGYHLRSELEKIKRKIEEMEGLV